MQGIDPKTLTIVSSILAVMLSVILFTMRRGFPSNVRGIGHWANAVLLFVVSAILFVLRDTSPLLHVIFANGLFIAGLLLMGAGLLKFDDRPARGGKAVAAAMAALLAAMLWFTFVDPSFRVRLVLAASALALLFAGISWLALGTGRLSLGRAITSTAFGVSSLICLMRVATMLIGFDRPDGLFDFSRLQVVYLAGFNVALLLGTVGFILMVNERMRESLEFLASHDALTGVLNRGAFFSQAAAAYKSCQRQQTPLSVLLLDLDHFKKINDQFGHHVGDRVLVEFCRAVRRVLRPSDVLGRYGGEEFAVLLPATSGAIALSVAERIRHVACRSDARPIRTVSIGCATTVPPLLSLDELLIQADEALYQAKRNGRDRTEAWAPDPEGGQSLPRLETGIRRALDPHGQPQIL